MILVFITYQISNRIPIRIPHLMSLYSEATQSRLKQIWRILKLHGNDATARSVHVSIMRLIMMVRVKMIFSCTEYFIPYTQYVAGNILCKIFCLKNFVISRATWGSRCVMYLRRRNSQNRKLQCSKKSKINISSNLISGSRLTRARIKLSRKFNFRHKK